MEAGPRNSATASPSRAPAVAGCSRSRSPARGWPSSTAPSSTSPCRTSASDLDASTSALQWILNGYLLTLASLILLGGSLGDRYGRRRVFVLGVGLFTAASLLCAVAPERRAADRARLLQGVGGALLTPGSLAMIEASFRPGDRARAIGAWSGLGGVAAAIGPLVGGYLIGAISWRAIFLINLPIGAFVVWAAATPRAREPRPDGERAARPRAARCWPRSASAGTTYALIEAPGQGASAAILVTARSAACWRWSPSSSASAAAANPMLPLEIFRSRQFSAANAVTFVVYAALGGVFFLLVAFLQISMGYTPIEAGAASLPVTAADAGLLGPGRARSRSGSAPASRSPSAR